MSVQVDDGGGTTLVNIGTLMLQKPAPAWDDDTLRTAEHELARVLGPMAKLIVRKAAAQTHDRVELCSMLADNIIDVEMRRKFVDAFNADRQRRPRGHRAGAQRKRLASVGTVDFASDHRKQAGDGADRRHANAGRPARPGIRRSDHRTAGRVHRAHRTDRHQRAAREAKSRSDFLRRVADNLGTQERAAFLKEVGLGGD